MDDRIPQGGFVHRMMPPTGWHAGDIPDSCYDKNKSIQEIRIELEKSYLNEENINRLAKWLNWRDNNEDPFHLHEAKLQLEMLAEIDATTIWASGF